MVSLGMVDKSGFYNCSMGHGQFRYVMNRANMFYIYVHAPCLHASILRFLSTLFKKMFTTSSFQQNNHVQVLHVDLYSCNTNPLSKTLCFLYLLVGMIVHQRLGAS